MPSSFRPSTGSTLPYPDFLYRCLLLDIQGGRPQEVETLLTREWAKDDHRGLKVFKAAVKGGQPRIIRCLLRCGVVPLSESPLFAAIEEMQALEVVLSEGYSVHVISSTSKLPLQVAITRNPAALPVLLRAGCDVTARDHVHGNTALHSACTQHAEHAILPLIQSGAWSNVPNWRGETPLHCLLNHACVGQDFHAKSRQNLARCLIHMGFRISTSSGQKSPANRGRPHYKMAQLYRQLVKDTRGKVWSLQHWCRLKVRDLCETKNVEGGDAGEKGEEEGDRAQSGDVVEREDRERVCGEGERLKIEDVIEKRERGDRERVFWDGERWKIGDVVGRSEREKKERERVCLEIDSRHRGGCAERGDNQRACWGGGRVQSGNIVERRERERGVMWGKGDKEDIELKRKERDRSNFAWRETVSGKGEKGKNEEARKGVHIQREKSEERGKGMVEIVEALEISRVLKDYLLFKGHVLDKAALSPLKTMGVDEREQA